MLLQKILFSDRRPVCQMSGRLVGHGVAELDVFDLCDVGVPWPKTGIRPVWERWEGAQLVVVPEVVWQLKSICDQTMWSPGDCTPWSLM